MATVSRTDNDAAFFTELKFWSRIKLRILEKYFDAYLRKRGGSNSTIYYVDGFAGPGHYGRGGEGREEGSPLRIARIAQGHRTAGKPYQLRCLFTEVKPRHCQNLEAALADFDADLVQVFCGSFQEHLPRILGIMQRAPAVSFLDPFGVVGISPQDLRPLLRRSDTEFLLNLNTRALRRMAGFEDSDAKEAQAKLARVSRTLGEDPDDPNPEWQAEWRRLNNPLEWERWAAKRYLQRLQEASPYLRYAFAYPIRTKYGGSPKYYLVFASRSADAFPIMNDILFAEEDELFAKSEAITARGQQTFFVSLREWERDVQLAALPEEIHAYGVGHQGCSRKQMIEHFSFDRLGEFKQQHYRQALQKLIDEGRADLGPGKVDAAPIAFR